MPQTTSLPTPHQIQKVLPFIHDLEAIASADMLLLCRMITTHVQADRFVGGHFLQVCRNGVVWAILRRLEQLVHGTQELAPWH